jgi:MFS family permease
VRARGLLVDVTPLRQSPDFRLLWLGQAVALVGRQITVVAVPVQLYGITGSSLAVGLVGLAQLVPLVVGSLGGGTLADAFDRRRVLLVTQLLMALTSAGLALNAMTGSRLWPIYVITAVSAGISGIDSPARNAAIPALVGKEQLPNALALNQTLFQVGQTVGPALAGVVIATASISLAYWIDVACFLVCFGFVVGMRPLRPEGGGTRPGLRSIGEGLRYLRGREALQGTFVVDINAMVFGMPRALFPAMADTVFGGGARTVGLLTAAPGFGALIGAVTTGWVARVRRQGLAVLWAVVAWGAAIAVFGATSWLPLALLALAVAGSADVVSAVFRNTILQLSVPDRLRGRLSAVHIAVVAGGPRLGDAEAGAVAAVAGPQVSAVSGGLLCVAGVWAVARRFPALARWTLADAVEEEPAPAATEAPGPEPA